MGVGVGERGLARKAEIQAPRLRRSQQACSSALESFMQWRQEGSFCVFGGWSGLALSALLPNSALQVVQREGAGVGVLCLVPLHCPLILLSKLRLQSTIHRRE